MSVLPLWCLSWVVFREQSQRGLWKNAFLKPTPQPTSISFLLFLVAFYWLQKKKQKNLWGDLCFVKMDLNKIKSRGVFSIWSHCVYSWPNYLKGKGSGTWWTFNKCRAAGPSLDVSGCQTIGKKTKTTKNEKWTPERFIQCFCPETDHSYARTALSVLSLIMLDVLIRGTLCIDRRRHAGRTHTDAEIWAITFFMQHGKNEQVLQPKRGYLGLLFLCNFLCNCTRWIPFLDVGAVFLRQEILFVCWMLRPQQSREWGE